MTQDDETAVKTEDFCMVEDVVAKPWTVFVMRDAVVALYPWNNRAPIGTHAEAWTRCVGYPVWIYEVDESLPPPELGQRAENPTDLGWVELGRHDPPTEH